MPTMPGTTRSSGSARSTSASPSPLDYEEAQSLQEGKFPRPPPMHATTAELFRATLGDDVVRLAEALEHEDVDVLARDQNLQTPLMFAAAAGSLECAEYLVDFGADFTLEDARGDTAFDLAVAAWGERHPDHPLLLYFKSLGAPRGRGVRSKMMSWLSG
mmetsp:Transcript_86512/g.234593  ORF Transcript_86512/g.234593 Transcript_86512/m.234593 type:complete len:159 (+) Transcript_86512:137-613(+)